jgi:Amt family ammonium transporter
MNQVHPTTFIGSENFFLIGYENYAFWMYQFAFAATSTTIVAGALAERSQMVAYFVYSAVLGGFVFPVIAHSVWSAEGFLNAHKANRLFGSGMIDFSGSGVVHVCFRMRSVVCSLVKDVTSSVFHSSFLATQMTGGLTALIASKILGPRKDRFNEDLGNPLHIPNPIHGYSVSLQVLGTFLLWFGWYGFNAGGLHFCNTAEYANVAALATTTTTLSACSGTISALALSAFQSQRQCGEIKFDISYALNGCLSALVGITGSCGIVEPWAAVVIGFVSGIVYIYASRLLVYLRIDDAVDAIPVHFGNGIWGVIAVGLFASPRRLEVAYGRADHVGWFYSWGRGSLDATLLGANIVGILFIAGFVLVVMLPFFSFLMCMGWFRSDPLEEILGLDCRYHRGVPTKDDYDDGLCNDPLEPHPDHSPRKKTLIEQGKTSGAYLHKLDKSRLHRLRDGKVVNFEHWNRINDGELHGGSTSVTAPCSTVVSDPTPTSRYSCPDGQPQNCQHTVQSDPYHPTPRRHVGDEAYYQYRNEMMQIDPSLILRRQEEQLGFESDGEDAYHHVDHQAILRGASAEPKS